MRKIIDPKELGLSVKTEIIRLAEKNFEIIKNRKSRIIMKDGMQIAAIADAILKKYPDSSVSFSTNAPLCSKTKKFLESNRIYVKSK